MGSVFTKSCQSRRIDKEFANSRTVWSDEYLREEVLINGRECIAPIR